MNEFDSIRGELAGRSGDRSGYPAKRGKPPARRGGRPNRPGVEPDRPRAPLASERSSRVAQDWFDRAERSGYRLPFNVNYLAHRVSERVVADQRMRRMLEDARHDDVLRLLLKMSERFWDEIVHTSDTSSNIANVFLDEVWDSLRDYAYDCLRAAYLKEHGQVIEKPEIASHEGNPLEDHRREVTFRRWAERLEEAAGEPPVERRKLTDRHREVLKSAKETRKRRDA